MVKLCGGDRMAGGAALALKTSDKKSADIPQKNFFMQSDSARSRIGSKGKKTGNRIKGKKMAAKNLFPHIFARMFLPLESAGTKALMEGIGTDIF